MRYLVKNYKVKSQRFRANLSQLLKTMEAKKENK